MVCSSCRNKQDEIKNQKELHKIIDKLSVSDRIILENHISKKCMNFTWIGFGLGIIGCAAVGFEIAFFAVV